MLKGHPKGLLVAFFANMGERFGYYTMLAIFVLYLQAKFGYDTKTAGQIYGGFLFGIYFLPLFGGLIADNWLGYGKTITIGTIVMFLGYMLLAMPGLGITIVLIALGIISLGTGLFKGNLQALVGNMYDDPLYSANRDNAFNIFYMGINIGAFFAPSAAEGISNWILKKHNFFYDNRIPSMAHEYLAGNLKDTSKFLELAQHQMGDKFTDLTTFAHQYIDTLSLSYNAGFAIAAASMIVSFLIFISFRKYYKSADITEKEKMKNNDTNTQVVELSKEETRERLIALFLVFFVVIFFWMAFHQNGFTLTIFARDYTQNVVGKYTYILFDLKALLPVITAIIGIIMMLSKKVSVKTKAIGGGLFVLGLGFAMWSTGTFQDKMHITPAKFQQFNPIFIVFLTPVVISFFSWLRKRKKEPTTPRKIGIGMLITGLGFLIMVIASYGLPSPGLLNKNPDIGYNLVSPYWLISTYFVLTIAELFLSPMGISFVSKVAPPKLKGLMQGGWLGATAVGNLLAGLIGALWEKIELWQFFGILVFMAVMSAIFIFVVIKKLDRVTK